MVIRMKTPKQKNKTDTHRLTFSAIMLAIATAISVACGTIPFLHLSFGGGFTLASMLPIVIVAYVYGTRWGLFTSFAYAAIQIISDLLTGKGSTILALPADFGAGAVFAIIVIDYLLAYTVLGFGGVFRNKIKSKTLSLSVGAALALFLRYLMHIISGYIFYGSYAEWFFSQEGFYKIGRLILDNTSGHALAFVYSVIYNGLYMIPEIVITVIAAVTVSRLPQIRKIDE